MVLLEYVKRHLIRLVLSLLILLFFLLHAADHVEWRFLHRLENFAYDARLLVTMPNTTDERIVIVDIDERSLGAEGRWPWGRNKLARLVDQLFDRYGASLVGFDVVFAEPDESSGIAVLETLARTDFSDFPLFNERLEDIRPQLDHDAVFAASLEGRPVILGYYFSDLGEAGEALRIGRLPPPVFAPGQFIGRRIDFLRARGYGANLPELQEAAQGAGHFNPYIDEDGVVRRVPMVYKYQDAYYEALSLAVVRAALGVTTIEPGYPKESRAGTAYSGIEWLEVGDRVVPVDGRVRALVPYRGKQGSFPYVSATDVLHGDLGRDLLRGKIVLVGTTAPGLLDLRSAPIQKVFPGVEIHANLISGILANELKQAPAYTLGAEVVVVIVAGLAITLLLPILSATWSTVTTAVVFLMVLVVNLAAWQYGNLVLAVASPLAMILAMFILNMSYDYFVESRGKRQLAGLFGQYVPPELVDEMSEHPESFSLEGESRNMTVLFTDVRSFTTISEGLDPKELSRLMNAFLTPMTATIHKHRGTIDKYMGDAIMAFWGAPLPDRDHARHGLQAGMEMLAELEGRQPEFRQQGWPEIRIGVGINTGEMSVGNMGSEFRMAYTVLGDAVNLGSRLEGLTKGYGTRIIVNETTKDAVPEYAFLELDRVRVKGKDKPVTIYEPIGPIESVDKKLRDEMKLYAEALKLYRAQNWDMAELQFLNLRQREPDRFLYQLYVTRIAHYRRTPPGPDWDGVFTHFAK